MEGNTGSTNCNVGVSVGGDFQNQGQVTNYVNCPITQLAQQKPSFSKKIHHFPQHSSNFYGRKRVLNDLENSVRNVQKLEAAFDKMIIISGFGGMGKSEIAKVLAHKMKDKFDFIFWFNAQSRRTMDSGFHQLLSLLKGPLKEEEKASYLMTSQTYCLLEEHFMKSLFIFDNAEYLKCEYNSSFGLEEYLLPELQCKKPVFLISTRNDWYSLEHKLKIIRLDELSEEESKVCFLKYLRLEGLEIPLSLSTTIDRLVDIVQGHPLGISLMGMEAARQEKEIFGDVEKRISNYLRLLKNQPLEELTGQEKYERNLQVIFDERMRKLEAAETGKDAAKILSILSLLSPDEIYVGLVDAIFCRKIFYLQKQICDSFSVGDSELRVERALKLLESNSLIRVESVEHADGTFDMIRIHRLLQRCAGKSKSVLLQQAHSFPLIAHFFSANENNYYFQGHISSILKFQEKTTFPLKNLNVLSLIHEFTHYHAKNEKRAEVIGLLSLREWKAEEKLVVSLIKFRVEPKAKKMRVLREIKDLMLELPEELTRKGWILELSTQVLSQYIDDFDRQEQRKLWSWLKKCYVECPSINRYFPGLLESVYKYTDRVVGADDGEYVLKVFSNLSERQRKYFWDEIIHLQDDMFIRLAPYFFPCSGETNLFVKSLEFPTREYKIYFLKYWAPHFCYYVLKVFENEDTREKLLGTENFAPPLKDITEFGFNENAREFNFYLTEGICHLLRIWLRLFSARQLTYERFGQFLDRLVIDLPESTRFHISIEWRDRWTWKDLRRVSLKFSRLEYCSRATNSWIQSLFSDESDDEDEFSEDEENSPYLSN